MERVDTASGESRGWGCSYSCGKELQGTAGLYPDLRRNPSRGRILMTGACYDHLVACGVLAAIGSDMLGIAMTAMIAGRPGVPGEQVL